MKKTTLYCIFYMLFPISLIAQVPDTLWAKTYGGDSLDVARSINQTLDGGYIIAGYTKSFGSGNEDVWLLKTDANGDTLWTKIFGELFADKAFSVQQTADSGYIIAGQATLISLNQEHADIWLLKTDENGDTIWVKTYGGIEDDIGHDVQQTSDGGYIIVGITRSYGAGGSDVYVVKTDVNGDTLWTKTYGGTGDEVGHSIQLTHDGGYIIAGRAQGDVWLIKTNSLGDTLWTKTYLGGGLSCGYSVQQTSDSGYVIAGNTHGGWCIYGYIIKTDQHGDSIWTRTGPWHGCFYDVVQTSDNCYISTGYIDGGYNYFLKVDESGADVWDWWHVGGCGYSGEQTSDQGYIFAGQRFISGYNYDLYLLKMESEVGLEEEIHSFQQCYCGTTIFRGPLQLPQDKSCRVFDITGREVKPHALAPGIYFIEVEGVVTQKVIKVR